MANVTATPGITAPSEQSTAYRPPQWAGQQAQQGNPPKALYMVSVVDNSSVSASATNTVPGLDGSIPVDAGTQASSTTTHYVFDAVLRASHNLQVTPTSFPVQTGAAMSDHAVIQPARITLEIGISDAMDSFSADLWAGPSSKSVNAFQALYALQTGRTLVTLTTRLNTYQNMLITGLTPVEDFRTASSLRMPITFQQIFQGSVGITPVSQAPEMTNTIQNGATQPSGQVDPAIAAANTAPDPTAYDGAAPFSCFPIANGPTLS